MSSEDDTFRKLKRLTLKQLHLEMLTVREVIWKKISEDDEYFVQYLKDRGWTREEYNKAIGNNG